ncbi:MAG TPA: right-handed parallel beta-helix repeat-containing protein [Anaerolineae bacterium]|nr:right-handed parallel beta-helix repeat-containing protein [Anaerolineae bacterium]
MSAKFISLWRFLLVGLCLITFTGSAQPIGLATPAIDPQACAPLPPPSGNIVSVATVEDLVDAVNSATSGRTILIANGTYNLDGEYLRIDVPNVTLRSASGNREAVILDGNYATTEIIQIAASNVTVADLTLREAYYHPVHVMTGDAAHTLNTLIYNVHIVDPGEQAIKINPATSGYYTDNGVIACSHIELTDAGRPHIRNNCYTGGVDAHQSRNWIIRDNLIEGFWCSSGLSEHGIHLWRGCRDTTVERNTLKNNARGIGFGLTTDPGGRTYPDNPCPAASGYVDDFGGVIRNNFVYASNNSLFISEYGFDCGICAWNSCHARILHNTVYSTDPAHTFSSIEWRFPNTTATLTNNLVNAQMRERDGAHGTLSGSLTNAQATWFANASTGDLHLRSTAVTVIDQVTAPVEASDDIDGDPRPIGSRSDVGADEYGIPAPSAVNDLRVTHAVTASNVLTATLRWTPPANALTTTLRYSGTLITAANWNEATLLTNSLSGTAAIFTTTVPYQAGLAYFALKAQNETGWSALSNNAFWPQQLVYLPVIFKTNP